MMQETTERPKGKHHRSAQPKTRSRRSRRDRLLNEFQPDAVELERQPVPGGARFTLYTVCILIGTFIWWSNWAEVDKIVKADGKLITIEEPIVIDAKLASPIKSLHYKFGEEVKAGSLLATFDPTFSDADVLALEAEIKSLTASMARLKAEKEKQEFSLAGHELDNDWAVQYQLYLERQNQYASELRKFAAKVRTNEVQIANTKIQKEAQLNNYAKFKKYENQIVDLAERGSKSSTDVLSRELQTSEAKMQVMQSDARLKELDKSLEAIDAEKEAFIASWQTQIVSEFAQVNDQMNSRVQELNKAVRSREFAEVRVPDHLPYKEFVVLEVSEKTVGSTMQIGEALCKLVPLGVEMEVEVDIEGKDVAVITAANEEQFADSSLPEGCKTRIKLASYPYQRHGTLEGIVRTISEGSFEKQAPNGAPTGITSYRARIKILDPNALEAVGDNFRLMPGMSASCEIKVGRRKVIEYFLYPLIRYLDSSFRER